MRDDPVVTALVTRARNGDKQAWDALVERYAPLIWSICRRHRLAGADANDVGQRVWLQLVDHLNRSGIRPRYTGGWPPRPAANAHESSTRRAEHTLPAIRRTPRPPRTIKPRRSSLSCSPPSATQRCARHSPA